MGGGWRKTALFTLPGIAGWGGRRRWRWKRASGGPLKRRERASGRFRGKHPAAEAETFCLADLQGACAGAQRPSAAPCPCGEIRPASEGGKAFRHGGRELRGEGAPVSRQIKRLREEWEAQFGSDSWKISDFCFYPGTGGRVSAAAAPSYFHNALNPRRVTDAAGGGARLPGAENRARAGWLRRGAAYGSGRGRRRQQKLPFSPPGTPQIPIWEPNSQAGYPTGYRPAPGPGILPDPGHGKEIWAGKDQLVASRLVIQSDRQGI